MELQGRRQSYRQAVDETYISTVEMERDTIHEKLEEICSQNRENLAQLTQYRSDNKMLEADFAQLKKKYEKKCDAVAKLERNKVEIESQFEYHKLDYQRLRIELDKKCDEVAKLQHDYKYLKHDYDRQRKSYEAQCEETAKLERGLNLLNETVFKKSLDVPHDIKIQITKNEIERYQETVKKLEEQKETIVNDIKEIIIKHGHAPSDELPEDIAKVIETYQARADELETEIHTAKTKLEERTATLIELSKKTGINPPVRTCQTSAKRTQQKLADHVDASLVAFDSSLKCYKNFTGYVCWKCKRELFESDKPNIKTTKPKDKLPVLKFQKQDPK